MLSLCRLNAVGLEHRVESRLHGLHVRVLLDRLPRLTHACVLARPTPLRGSRPRRLAGKNPEPEALSQMTRQRLLQTLAQLFGIEVGLVALQYQNDPVAFDRIELAMIREIAYRTTQGRRS